MSFGDATVPTAFPQPRPSSVLAPVLTVVNRDATMMARARHPKQEVEEVLRYAESKGWRVEIRGLMPEHEFTLVMRGPDVLEDQVLEHLYGTRCDDATFGEVDGVQYADFGREAPSMQQALESAMRDISRVVPDIRFIRVEPDELVSAAEIAARLGRSRESVRLWIEGQRGPGGFPPPVTHLRSRSPRWRWTEVTDWLTTALDFPVQLRDDAYAIAEINARLEAERLDVLQPQP